MNVGWISFGSTCFESRPSTSFPQPSSALGSEPIAAASASRVGCSRMSIPALLADRVAQGDPPPGRGEVDLDAVALDLGRAEHALGDLADQPLEPRGGVLVVGVGLVPLEHRELGVVLERDPLVAEVLAELVDPVDPADDAALQVELGRDPQVEVAVEGVVVGDEGSRQGAAVERLQDRRLDLDEAVDVEPAADLGDRSAADPEDLARLRVGDQVELAVAVAGSRCP